VWNNGGGGGCKIVASFAPAMAMFFAFARIGGTRLLDPVALAR